MLPHLFKLPLYILILSVFAYSVSGQPPEETAGIVRERISLNGGTLQGNLQLTEPHAFNLNSGFSGEGFIFLPGQPDLRVHARSNVGKIEEGDGNEEPSGYRVRVNPGVHLEGIRTQVDPPEFPYVSWPPEPTGDRDFRLNSADGFEGDFDEIRDITLRNGAGSFYLPPGHYGELRVHRGARLLLGIDASRDAAVYTFTRIHWYDDAELELFGPVSIKTGSFPISLGGTLGDPGRPEWLTLGFASGGLNVNRGASFFGTLIVPDGRVILNADSEFCGQLFARDLTLNSNASLSFCGPGNQPPTAAPVMLDLPRYGSVEIDLRDYASDPDGREIDFEVLTDPEYGVLATVQGEPMTSSSGFLQPSSFPLTYTPEGGFFGKDSFSYRVFDGEYYSEEANVQLEVVFVNHPPVAESQEVLTHEDSEVAITLSAFDLDSDELSYTVVGDPANGTVGGAAPELIYTPHEGFYGVDSFTFVANDGHDDSEPATVTVEVNARPRVKLVAPGEGSVFLTPASVELVAEAEDPDGTVESVAFALEGEPLGEVTESPFAFAWDEIPPREYAVHAIATDDRGATGVSDVLTFTIRENSPPFFVSEPPLEVFEESFYQYSVTVSDPDLGFGDVVSVVALEKPDWLSLTDHGDGTAALEGIPSFADVDEHLVRLKAIDSKGLSASQEFVVVVQAVNRPPVVDAGPDVVLEAPGDVFLEGTVTDDGLPLGSELVSRWRVLSGDADQVSFDDDTKEHAVASFGRAGEYVLRLTASDGEAVGHDDMRVFVPNQPPMVDAGADLTVVVGRAVDLAGSVTDDGVPAGGMLASHWSVEAGDSAAVVFESTWESETKLRVLAPGTYLLRLSAHDGELSAHDEVEVTVVPVPNAPPVVDAGPDQDLLLHSTSRLFGSVEDDGLPENGVLTYEWSQVAGPPGVEIHDPADLKPSVMFSEAGEYRFRLMASDGEFDDFDETIVTVALTNQAPVVDAGGNFEVAQGEIARLHGTVADDGLPLGGALSVEWSVVSGPGSVLFTNPSSAVTTVEVSHHGEYRFRLWAHDGELESFDEVIVRFGPPVNQPPVVDAGPDQSVDFNVVRTENLLVNGAGGEPSDGSEIPGWEQVGASWLRVQGGASGLPQAAEGSHFFRASDSVSAELRQDVDVELFAEPIDEGSQLFEFSLFYRVAEQVRYDEPRVRVEYRNAAGEILTLSDIEPTPLSASWGFLADTKVAPEGTREIRVRLLAENSGVTAGNDVYFDGVSLRGVHLPPVQLAGTVEDDGLPEDGILTAEWRTVSGPVAAIFEDPHVADTRSYFSVPGDYELALQANDGEASAEDRMTVTVMDQAGAQPLRVDAGADLTALLPLGLAHPEGVIEGGLEGEVRVSWAEVGDSARVFIENPDSLTPDVRFYEAGEYTLRLSVSDGQRVAFDEMRVAVECPSEIQPIDVVMVIDKSGSMLGERMVNARLAAQQFIERMLPHDRAAVVPFDSNASLTQPLTFNHQAAISTVESINAGGGTAIHAGIDVGADELVANGRPDAQWVILLLSDGMSNYSAAVHAAQAAHASGIRIIPVGLGSGTDEQLMVDTASSRPDYFFADTGADLEPIYDGLSRSFCRVDFPSSLNVFTGPSQELPNLDVKASLPGRVTHGHLPDDTEIVSLWEKVSGPGEVFFEDPDSPVTDATFSESGVYALSLTVSIYMEDTLLEEKVGRLNVIVDQPSDALAPSGLLALWKGEWNVHDSVSNFHGTEPANVAYADGVVQQGFDFGSGASRIEVPTEGQLDVGRSQEGFTVEFWARIDSASGTQRLFGWHDVNGGGQFGLQKVSSNLRLLRIVWRNEAGVLFSVNTPSGAYVVGKWHHFAITYSRSDGVIRIYRDGVYFSSVFDVGNEGIPMDGDFVLGGHLNYSQTLLGGLDEISIYDRPLKPEEISFVSSPEGKVLLGSNEPPFVDAGPDIAVQAAAGIATLRGFAVDDGLPLGSALRTSWSKVSGPGEVTFADPFETETTVEFDTPGIYTLELAADDGIVISRDTLRVVVEWSEGVVESPAGLRAHWPGEGTGRELISGFDAEPVGEVSYSEGLVGEAFHLNRNGFLLARTDGGLNAGESSDGFTIEFWAKIDSTLIEQVLAGWYDEDGAEFAITKRSSSLRGFMLRWRDADGQAYSQITRSGVYTLGQWQHFAFSYDYETGQLHVYNDGTHLQTLNLPAGGFSTRGDFLLGGRAPFAAVLDGALDEVSVYDRQLSPAEIWAVKAAGSKGKSVDVNRTSPVVDAGFDFSLTSIQETGEVKGFVAVDDGLPLGSVLRTSWSKVSGPGEVTFGDPFATETTVEFDTPGIYTLELAADDGIAISRDTLRVVVEWSDGAVESPAGLRAHWPGEGTGRELISGFDAEPVGEVSYSEGLVGKAFHLNRNGFLLARTDGGLNAGESSDGFTIEFWAKIDSSSIEQVLAGWYDEDGAEFAITKRSSSLRGFMLRWRDADGQAYSQSTWSGVYTLGQWQHFAFSYDYQTGQVHVYNDGTHLQTLNLPAEGFSTRGDFLLGGRAPFAAVLDGALDEVSVYDRQLSPAEIWAVKAAGSKGKSVDANRTSPVVDAGFDFSLTNIQETGEVKGFVAVDEGLPLGSALITSWSKVSGPGEVTFGDPFETETTVEFDTPGIYTLELAADDGIVISRDTLRVVVEWSDGAVESPAGLRAHWPGEGTGRELIGGFDAEPVGEVSYSEGLVGEAFHLNRNGFLLARTDGGLNAGESSDGFTIEFWAKIDSSSIEQVLAGWYDEDGAEFAITKRSSSLRGFMLRWRDADGQARSQNTRSGSYTLGQWQHFAFSYDYPTGQLHVYNDGTHFQTLNLPAEGFSTRGDFLLGGRAPFAAVLDGALDEVSVYDRQLDATEIAEIHAAGNVGKRTIPRNQPPFVFAGFDRSYEDVLSFTVEGYARDDGLPEGSELQLFWTQVGGPAPAEILSPEEVISEVTVPESGDYTFRLTASDGEFSTHSDVTIQFVKSVPKNIPPVADAGDSISITLPSVAVLDGVAYDADDGPLPLETTWSGVTGPGEVVFENPAALDTIAQFTVPGRYILRLAATDGVDTVFDDVEITVYPVVLNEAPVVDAGEDFTKEEWEIVTLHGVATDDGIPDPLQVTWRQVSGPAPAFLESPHEAVTRAQFPEIGTYVLELRAFDGEKEGIDTVTVTVVDPINQPPVVDAGGPLSGVIGEPVVFQPIVSDDGLPDGYLTTSWTYTSGPGGSSLDQTGDGQLAATFANVGEHRFTLTVSDGEYEVTDDVVVTVTAPNRSGPSVTLTAPESGGETTVGSSVFFEAIAEDPEGSVESVVFYANGAAIATVADDSPPYRFLWEGVPVGTYELTAVARNEIGQSAASEPVSVEVLNVPPGVTLAAPDESSFHPSDRPVTLWAAGTGGAALASVDFLVDDQLVATADSAPFIVEELFASAGTRNLRARALTASGQTLDSETISVTIVASSEEDPDAEILSPVPGETITSPTEISGFVAGGALDSYQLQFRPSEPGAEPWQTIASGAAPLGTAEEPATLGLFDPTLLRNGIYELRLSAGDPMGATFHSETVPVVIDGGMKVGHFQLAFEDLQLPVAGIPIQLIRSYDSRGGLGNDFGPDWDLGFRSVQVHTSGVIGRGWEDYLVRFEPVTGIPVYGVRPVRRQVVSVVVDDDVQQFEVYSPTEQGFFELSAAAVAFRPINESTGTLALPDSGNFPVERVNGEVRLTDFFEVIDPAAFIYTSVDGTRLEIERIFGLRKLTDRNAKSLTFSENGITHSSGESIAFIRDPEGRIITIEDPDGGQIDYTYDQQGYLASVTNRADEATWFEYIPHPAAPDSGRMLLDAIIDPLGNRAVAADYDSDGRLLSQTDADGRAITFTHDIPNRRRVVTDRLGHETIHEYDLRGNVVRTIDPLGHETLREYDNRDNEIRTTDALGNVTERSYDDNNNLLSETAPDGAVTSYAYDSFGSPLTISDPLGNETAFSYDNQGNLLTQADALRKVTSFEYDPQGNLTAMVDPENNRTEFAYDTRGNQTLNRVRDSSGTILRETHSSYDSRGNQLTCTVSDLDEEATTGLTTQYFYDAENRLIRTIDPDGGETETIYDSAGQEIQHIDALGRVTEFEYDARGNRTRTIHPDGSAETSQYDSEDNLVSETDALGNTTIYEYDALGRQIAVIHPDGTATDTIYDEIGRKIATADERGNITQYEYDEDCGCANRRSRVIDALGNITHYTYDAAGNRTSITDARGHTTSFEYDALNRPIRTIHPDGTTTETAYDALGRRIAETDQEGRIMEYEYDPLGRLVTIIQPKVEHASSVHPITRYEYDEFGNRTAQIDALGRTTRYEYDTMGHRTKRILPGGEEESYEYDAAGRLVAKTDMNGYTNTYTYDARDRLVTETADHAHPSLSRSHAAWRHVHEYDVAGRRTLSAVLAGPVFGNRQLYRETLHYDVRGQLIRKEVEQGTSAGTIDFHLDYEYDDAGNLTGILSSNEDGAAALYTHDELNHLATVEDRDGGLTDYSYNAVGSLEGYTYPNQVSTTFTYDSLNRLTNLQSARAGSSSPLADYHYTLRPSGHRATVFEQNGRRIDYSYDGLYRLTDETVTNDAWNVNGSVGYTHDLVGNRLMRTSTLAGIEGQTFAFDVNDRIDTHAYDNAGNPTGGEGRLDNQPGEFTDSYDFQNRLIRRLWDNGTEILIAYDTDGNRFAKTVTQGSAET